MESEVEIVEENRQIISENNDELQPNHLISESATQQHEGDNHTVGMNSVEKQQKRQRKRLSTEGQCGK